jgi:hypothetical protein
VTTTESKPEFPADVWRTASDMPLDDTGDMDHDISVAIARGIMAERERCASKWLPIESAPKDRTAIIVAVPDKDRASFHVGEAYFDPETGEYKYGDWWWAGIDWSDYHTGPISEVNFHLPTHWMPLPPPPNGDVRG